MKKYDDRFQLNTGVIYSNEFMYWIDTKEYRNAILEMENNIQELFERRKIKPLKLDPGSPYEEQKLLEYKYLRQRSALENGPPFTEIFLTQKSDDDSFELDFLEELSRPTAFVEGPVILDPFDVEFDSEQNIVKPVFDDIDQPSEEQINMDNELQTRRQPVLKRFMYEYSTDLVLTRAKDSPKVFDFFMGFALRQVHYSNLDQFLFYQLAENYASNTKEFKRIIEMILRKMYFLFDESTIQNVKDIIEVHFYDSTTESAGISNTNRNFRNLQNTTRRQVIAMQIIFKALDIRNIDNSAKARVIEFLTGKNSKNIYDMVCKPLAESDIDIQKDYEMVKSVLEELGDNQIITLVNEEMRKNTKNLE
jgi:hypothetical protein